MAAIDKLYLKSYTELETLRVWALVYYPKLFWHFYDEAISINYSDFHKYKRKSAKANKKAYLADWRRISPDNTINGAIATLMAEPYHYSEKDAIDEAKAIYANSRMTTEELESNVSLAVMNTPFKVDKKLKWICPVPCIREYLKRQCGVKERWYYKLFWKGKKYFQI